MSSEQQQALEFTAVTLLGKAYELRDKVARWESGGVPKQVRLDVKRAREALREVSRQITYKETANVRPGPDHAIEQSSDWEDANWGDN